MNGRIRFLRAIMGRPLGKLCCAVLVHRSFLCILAVAFCILPLVFPMKTPVAFAQGGADQGGSGEPSPSPQAAGGSGGLAQEQVKEILDSLQTLTQELRTLKNISSDNQTQIKRMSASLPRGPSEDLANILDEIKSLSLDNQKQIQAILANLPQGAEADQERMDQKADSSSQKLSTLAIPVYVATVILGLLVAILYLLYRVLHRLCKEGRQDISSNLEKLGELSDISSQVKVATAALGQIRSELQADQLSSIPDNVKAIPNKLGEIRSRLESLEKTMSGRQTPVENGKHPTDQESSFPPMDPTSERIRDRYNAVAGDFSKQIEFKQHNSFTRVGVTNAMDRCQNPSIKPIFRSMAEGDFLALPINKGMRYAVVPRFDLTLQESSYGPGAMGQVFHCPGYNPGAQYRRVKVVKPAIFRLNSGGQWDLLKEGELDLENGGTLTPG